MKCQPEKVAIEADYPVSHIDLGARHAWLMAQRDRIGAGLLDATWPGDARVAGWWLWGQCCWIGSGWCEWAAEAARGQRSQIPHLSSAGMGVHAAGQIPHASDAGRGVLLTSSGHTAWEWLRVLAGRLERVRVTHGSWERCLNHHYGAADTAVFLDPPYRAYEDLYKCVGVADAVEAWALANAELRIAICGHIGDYPTLVGWECLRWSRGKHTYGGSGTTDKEAIWFSPACIDPTKQGDLFARSA